MLHLYNQEKANRGKNIIFSHHKNLNIGDYLIDDSTKNGAAEFNGEHIQIHSDKFPNWNSVNEYIFNKENINLMYEIIG